MNPPRDHFAGAGITAASAETSPDVDPIALERLIRAHNEIMSPGYLAAGGHTEANLGEPSKTLTEATDAGWITAEEKRMIDGVASRADMLVLGHSIEEVEELLAEQQVRACARLT